MSPTPRREGPAKWPKALPPETEEQRRIKDDWMKYWLGVLPARYGALERFNHGYPGRRARPGARVLEIGAGLGEHLRWEGAPAAEYHAMELRPEIAQEIRETLRSIQAKTSFNMRTAVG